MQRKYHKSLVASILLHIVVLSVLIVSFDFTGQMPVLENNSPTSEVIHAVVMNTIPAPQQQSKPMPAPPLPQKPIVKPVAQPPPKVIPVAKPKVLPPKKDVIAIDVKKQKKIQHDELQTQLLAELKQQELQQKKLKQKALENAFASEIKNLSAKALKQQMKAEQSRIADNMQSQKMHGIIDKYRALILQAIGHYWLIPGNVDKNLTTKLLLRVEANGAVIDVQIYQSSGNVALDNSARAAVFKASPLPVPTKPDEFEPFRQFVLVFRPVMFKNGELAPLAQI